MPDSSIRLYSSSWSSITGNIVANYWGYSNYGIRLEYSSSNNLTRNFIINSTTGILLWDSSSNTIRQNILTNNKYDGVGMAPHSDDNTVIQNAIMNNKYGMSLDSSNNNIIYHNLFRNNDTEIRSFFSINTWDDGYPSGGNYWSDHTGVDEKSGPYQNETGSDGISDTPYIIDENNVDNYPLMNPYIAGDVNYDGIINTSDLSALGKAYGAMPDSPNWNVRADINDDLIVNVIDLFTLGKNFGKTGP